MAATSPGSSAGWTHSSTQQSRRFPTGADYVEALQSTALCFRDSDLKGGTVELDMLRRPKPISGNFASVFSVTSRSGRRYAVKCFTREIASQERRYDAISRHLTSLDPVALSKPWRVSFDYQRQGVLVGGQWYPIVKMEWVEGTSLIRWIDHHHRDAKALASLATRFADLVADLSAAGVAHGDLQHGNLLVAADGTFRLVDYDGMYVPALAGQTATENGHRNYQSPNRSARDFGPAMDRFSAWVIYVSLIALSIEPSFWNQLHDADGEFLLLSEADFKDPSNSKSFRLLLNHRDRTLKQLAERVKDLPSLPMSALPDLSAGLPTSGRSRRAPTAAVPAPTVPAQSPSGSAMHPWLAGHLPPSSPAAVPAGNASAAAATVSPATGFPTRRKPRTGLPWFAGHLPPSSPAAVPAGNASAAAVTVSPPTGFAGRYAPDVVLASIMVLILAAPATLMAVSARESPLLLTAQGGALLGALLSSGVGWWTRPEVRAARRVRGRLRRQMRYLEDPAMALAKLEKEFQAFVQAEFARSAQETEHMKQLQTQQLAESAEISMALDARLTKIDQQIADLRSQEHDRLLAEALASLREAHIQDRLRRYSIQDAKLSNITSQTIDALISAGIRTAADFTSVRYVSGGNYNNVTAYFVLSSGYETRVPGVGEKRAQMLESWRQSLEARARWTAPTTLSASQRSAIANQISITSLVDERKAAESEAQSKRDRLNRRIAAERKSLADAQNPARTDAMRRRKEIESRRTQLSNLQARLLAERQARRQVSYTRYLRFLFLGR